MRPAEEVAGVVSAWCEARFELASSLTETLERGLTARHSSVDVDVAEAARQMIARSEGRLAGAGVVLAPGVLDDVPSWFEWWQAAPGQAKGCQRLAVELDPHAPDFRDYTQLAWFSGPASTGLRHVTGPYVDYLCTDQYTLTFTRPVLVDGRFAGVAGVDVLVRSMETELGPTVEGIAPDCVLVNGVGRVVASTADDWTTGDLVRDWASESQWSAVACPGLPWRVLEPRAG